MKKNIIILVFLIACSSLSIQAQLLTDYYKIAAENNPGLQSKFKDFEAALQQVPQAKALADPTISFGYFISPIETRVGPQRAKFSLTQMFPWFGTLKLKENAAALIAEAKYQEFLEERNRLYYQVAAAYYPLFELERWISIEKENIEILKSFKTIATKQFESGNGAMVDVLRIDIILKDAITNLHILETKKTPLVTGFNVLLNKNIEDEVTIIDSLIIEDLINYRRDSLLLNNPVLEAIEIKLKASEEMEQVAIKQGLPKIGIGLDYAIVAKRPEIELPENGRDILMPMISMSIPLYRGKYDAAVKEAQLNQESFQFKRESYANSLVANYDYMDYELSKERQLIELYDQQITESEQALNLLYTSYANSGKEFEEVLRMQQQLLKYEKLKATSQSKFYIILAKIDYITAKKY